MEGSITTPERGATTSRRSPLRRRGLLWIACACLPGVACAVSHDTDRTALRQDHERCLQDARNDTGRVSYGGYQSCMDALGWPAVDQLPRSHAS